MKPATKRAIREIEAWSEQVVNDPTALGNKLKAERTLFEKILIKALTGLRALNYSGWIALRGTYLICYVPTGKISVQGMWPRTVRDIIGKDGDFEELVQTLITNHFWQ